MAVKSYKNFIGGEWKTSSSGETFKNVNPANAQEVVGRFQQATSKDVNSAVSAAHRALPEWKKTPAPKRGELL